MAYRCHECLYDYRIWCEKYKYEPGCGNCERLDTERHCKCLLVDDENCPDFVPKEEKNEAV